MWKNLTLAAKPPRRVLLSSLPAGEASVSHIHVRYEEKERLFPRPITSDFRTVLRNIPG